MGRVLKRRPSPAMLVAIAALVAAVGGTAIAGPLASKSALSKKEKKQVKKIAKSEITTAAPGLSVANSSAVGNAPLAEIAKVANATDTTCAPAAAFAVDCVGATITTTRTTDISVIVTSQWHSDDAIGTNVEGNCRIEKNEVNTSSTSVFGTTDDDTAGAQYERAVAVSETDLDQPAGTYLFELSCDVVEGDFDLADVETTVIATGS